MKRLKIDAPSGRTPMRLTIGSCDEDRVISFEITMDCETQEDYKKMLSNEAELFLQFSNFTLKSLFAFICDYEEITPIAMELALCAMARKAKENYLELNKSKMN